MVSRSIDCLRDRTVNVLLNRGLHTDVLFRSQIVCSNKVVRQLLVRMLLLICFREPVVDRMGASSVSPNVLKVKIRFDTGAHTREDRCRTSRCLSQEYSVANTVLSNIFSEILWKRKNEWCFEELLRVEVVERSAFLREFNGGSVRLVSNEAVEILYEGDRLLRSVTKLEQNQQVRKT